MFVSLNLTNFGTKLKEIRERNGLTQKAVFERTGISIEPIRNIEKSKVIAKFETLEILSNCYKTELLLLLQEQKFDFELRTISQKIDSVLISNDMLEFENLVQEFEKITSELDFSNSLLNSNDVDNFRHFLEAIRLYYSSRNDHYSGITQLLTNILISSNPKFQLSKIDRMTFDFFENRVLLLLGIIEGDNGNIELSNLILSKCLRNSDFNDVNYEKKHLIQTKILANLAYNYHLTDNHEKVIELSSKAIELCDNNHSTYCLSTVLFRRGIAKHLLQQNDAFEDLSRALLCLLSNGQHKLLDNYVEALKTHYNLHFDYDYSMKSYNIV